MDCFANGTESYERKHHPFAAAESVVIEKRGSLDPTPRIPSDEQDFKTFLAALVPDGKRNEKTNLSGGS
jgi:hypothetical protein